MSDTTPTQMDNALAELPRSILELIAAVRAEPRMSAQQAALLLERSRITAEELAPWTRFGHPRTDSYGRGLILDAGFFELMVMSWDPGDMSAIHDHGYTMWGAVKIYGRAEHAVFNVDGGLLSTRERCMFDPGSIVAVDHELIHQMGNTGSEPFISLHLYGCHERNTCVTADSRIFDLDEGRIQVTTGGAFFLLPEDEVSERPAEIQGDFPSWLRHNIELLRRLDRMQPLEGRSGLAVREARLLKEFNNRDTWQALQNELRLQLPRRDAESQQSYIESLSRELACATELFLKLHAAGRFNPDEQVIGLIGSIVGMLEQEDFIQRIAGEPDD